MIRPGFRFHKKNGAKSEKANALQIQEQTTSKEASKAYIKFLEAGGKILQTELDESLIKKYLKQSVPILTGLSATYLYGTLREIPVNNKFDSIRGEPVGHFVIVNGFDETTNTVYLADPMNPNPLKSQYYSVNFDRLINSIMLGNCNLRCQSADHRTKKIISMNRCADRQ